MTYTARHFRTEKVGRNHTNIFRGDEYLCQLRNREVADWLRRSDRAVDDEIAFAAERKVHQAARVADYLAKRAARPPQPRQLDLF